MTKLQMPSDSEAYFYFRTGDYPILHSHDGYWEFIYVTSGEYTHEINGELRVIKPGLFAFSDRTTRTARAKTRNAPPI